MGALALPLLKNSINTPNDDFDYKNEKIPESLTIEKLQQQRDQELNNLGMKR